MSFIGNIVWLIFGGLPAAIGYFIGGVLFCISIIGIPFGLASLRLASGVLTPFGKSVVSRPSGQGVIATIFNVLWLILFGWAIAITHVVGGLILAITIVGLPFAQQHFKLIPVALFPFSYELK
ncbi:MAG: YccF domain-containing protein [Chloroflexi bacterium]|nr:YccF domain-containing protein [Chloroflexota bacterium]MCC6895891.1 YccF domain-containing protein [Anaerolineae bacterium]